MATAPFQLWLDIAPIASASRTGSTVTITTTTAHGLPGDSYVQIGSITGTAGTSMVGVYKITATASTAFTYTAAGSAGTGTITTAFASVDLFAPLIDYAAANRQSALYAIPESVQMSASGDGSGASLSMTIAQDDTPTDGPWFTLIPDEARVRLVKANTGTTPATDKSDLFFVGTIQAINSRMNGSGQGTISDVNLADPTSALDRVVLYGAPGVGRLISEGGISRASNVVTVTTVGQHGYKTNSTVFIRNVIGGGTATFNGQFTVSGTPTTTTFTYANTGADATGNNWVGISAASVRGGRNVVRITTASAHNLIPAGKDGTQTAVRLKGLTSTDAVLQNFVNGTFSGVKLVSGTAFEITLPGTVAVSSTITTTGGSAIGAAYATTTKTARQSLANIAAGETETTTATRFLSTVNQVKFNDYAFQRVLDTSDATLITGSTTELNKSDVNIPPTTLRSALDSLVETFSGQDGKVRRYWVNRKGQLAYQTTDPTSVPTYANAPYKIIVTGTQNTDTTSAAATVIPYDLQVMWDHNTTKTATFTIATTTDESIPNTRTYIDAGYVERKGAPQFDTQLDFSTSAQDQAIQVTRGAQSYFLEAHKPLLSIQFTLRGAGKAAHNNLGYSAGYYQSGTATFALQSLWEPGQWVSITAAELGLSGLYRVEAVDWALEPGSFFQVITVTANRRPTGALTSIVQKVKKGHK